MCARPVTKGWSRSSMSEVSRLAASASVRATSSVGTPHTSAARRAAASLLTASLVGTSTLPPMWPHFFAEDSWSSKCTPAAPASIMSFISSKALSTPPKPASASATIGCIQSMLSSPFGVVQLVGTQQGALILRTTAGTELAGYRDWSGYISPARLASPATCQPDR